MSKFILLLALIIGLSSSTYVTAGQSSHGSDNKGLGDNAAWFLGAQKTIKYCYELSPSFGLDAAVIESTLADSFNQWAEYITRKLPLSIINAFDASRSYTLNSALQLCNGNEDLKFYFGVEDQLIATQKPFYNDPAAFAHLTTYNSEEGWGKGLVWMTNPRNFTFLNVTHNGVPSTVFLNWQDPYVFKAMILHELGHIFGNEHVPDTIMDENILKIILAPKLFPQECANYSPLLAEIDSNREVVPCIRCEEEQISQSWLGSVDQYAFADFTGRSAVGDVVSKLKIEYPQRYVQKLILELSDSVSSSSHVLNQVNAPVSPRTPFDEGENVFNIFFTKNNRPMFGNFRTIESQQRGDQSEYVLFYNNRIYRKTILLMWGSTNIRKHVFNSLALNDVCSIPSLNDLPFWSGISH